MGTSLLFDDGKFLEDLICPTWLHSWWPCLFFEWFCMHHKFSKPNLHIQFLPQCATKASFTFAQACHSQDPQMTATMHCNGTDGIPQHWHFDCAELISTAQMCWFSSSFTTPRSWQNWPHLDNAMDQLMADLKILLFKIMSCFIKPLEEKWNSAAHQSLQKPRLVFTEETKNWSTWVPRSWLLSFLKRAWGSHGLQFWSFWLTSDAIDELVVVFFTCSKVIMELVHDNFIGECGLMCVPWFLLSINFCHFFRFLCHLVF